MWPYPWLVDVKMLHCVLFFVFPFHMLLLVADGVPPDVEETIGPNATMDEEGAEIESSTVLRYDEVNRVGMAVTVG